MAGMWGRGRVSVRIQINGCAGEGIRVRVTVRVRVRVRVRDRIKGRVKVRGGGLLPTTSHSTFYRRVGHIATFSHCQP